MVEEIKKSLPAMWKSSPPWFALLAVVTMFLFYLDRQESRVIQREQRMEALSSLRIETCHAIQEQSTTAIKELNEVLREQVQTMYKLQILIESQKQ